MSILVFRANIPEVIGKVDVEGFDRIGRELIERSDIANEIAENGFVDLFPSKGDVTAIEIATSVSSLIRPTAERWTNLVSNLSDTRPVKRNTSGFRIEDVSRALRVDRYHCDTWNGIPWPTVMMASRHVTNTLVGILPIPEFFAQKGPMGPFEFLKSDDFQHTVTEALDQGKLEPYEGLTLNDIYVINGIHNRIPPTSLQNNTRIVMPRISAKHTPLDRSAFAGQLLQVAVQKA